MESELEKIRHVLRERCSGKYNVEVEKSMVPGFARVILQMVFPLGPPSGNVKLMEGNFRQNVEEMLRDLEPEFRVTTLGPVVCEKL